MAAELDDSSPIPTAHGISSSRVGTSSSFPNTESLPPPLPLKSIYTSCYCEENIYLLAQAFVKNSSVATNWSVYVLFLSNETKSVGSELN